MCSDQTGNFPKKLYTVAETAAILGVSIKTLRKWLDNGNIPYTRLGPAARLIRIRGQDIENFLRAGEAQTHNPDNSQIQRNV